jgi:Ca-activated chloride channel family protein
MGADVLHPEWGAGALAVAAGAAIAVTAAALRARRRLAQLMGGRVPPRSLASELALCVALGAIAFALVGPLWARRDVAVTGSGTDLVLLFDASRSMDARDNPPSRLARARRGALGVLERLGPGHRVALAAYADRGVLLTPLTPDSEALATFVPAIDTDLVRPAGSNLADGLRAALEAFEPGSARPRVVVVWSDGEVRPALGADDLRRLELAGVRGLAVGLGAPHGTTIPDGGVPLRDGRGEIVVSRRVTGSLEKLAAASGGRLWLADDWGDLDVDTLVAEIERDSRAAAGGAATRRVRAPLVMPFAALAFALLALECAAPALRVRSRRPRAISAARRPRSGLARRPAAATAAVLVFLGLGSTATEDPFARIDRLEAAAATRPLRPAELIELGVARFEAGRTEEARHALRSAAHGALAEGRTDHAALAYHDLGVLAYERGDLPAARDHFLEAVALAPGQLRSRFNLEWTLRAMTSSEEPPAPSPSGNPTDEPEVPPDRAEPDEAPPPEIASQPAPRPTPPEPGEPAAPESAPGEADGGAAPAPDRAPLDAAQARRWLDRLEDDPRRALRSAARADAPRSGGRSRGPAW